MDGSALGRKRPPPTKGLRTTPASKTDFGRPTTPSWADFLSSGFVNEGNGDNSTHLLPPDKILPPINTRANSSQSHRRDLNDLEPGELASINALDLDDTFWWVWITSLAGEETVQRKSAFGRCALIETRISGGKWLIMEEIIKGAAAEPEAGAYIAEKKGSIFSFSRRGRLTRSKSSAKGALPKPDAVGRSNMTSPFSKTSIAPDQHARIQAAAAALQQKHQQEDVPTSPRRARKDEGTHAKTSSVFTLQPVIMSEAAPAMKWAHSYDKSAIRAKYLGDNFAGKGSAVDLSQSSTSVNRLPDSERGPPPPAKSGTPTPRNEAAAYSRADTSLVDIINQGPPQGRGQSPVPPPKETATGSETPRPAVPSKDTAAPVAQVSQNSAVNPSPALAPAPAPAPTAEYPRPMERNPVPPLKQSEEPALPSDPNTFFLSASVAPALVSSRKDIVEYKVEDASAVKADEIVGGFLSAGGALMVLPGSLRAGMQRWRTRTLGMRLRRMMRRGRRWMRMMWQGRRWRRRTREDTLWTHTRRKDMQ